VTGDVDIESVVGIIETVAAVEIVPRFRRLGEADVSQKGPGDPVTVADRTTEQRLSEALQKLMPGSVVVGEEAVAADPSILGALDGQAPVWIIDPIDGTRNFVAGDPHFSTLVALACGGELIASWTHAPLLDATATALVGHGAWLNGERIRVVPTASGLAGLDVATSHSNGGPTELGTWSAPSRTAESS
jgi:fructose-1,6-bisphosphatase/inositol monophosphatase family enzyme